VGTATFPGLTIFIIVLAYLVGDGLNDALTLVQREMTGAAIPRPK